jgi:pilus assembly protein CpaF
VVFCKQLENKQRRMMEIQECEILPDGTRQLPPALSVSSSLKTVWRTANLSLRDIHEQVNTISDSLAKAAA